MEYFTIYIFSSGRQHFENSLHGKQLKIAQKHVAPWETAVKVAEKAKPMNRHERQLCYTFKYYDKNEGKRLPPLKMKKLNGFTPLPEQVNGLVDEHANEMSNLNKTESPSPDFKDLNGDAHCANGFLDKPKKIAKEKVQRKRKLTAVVVASKSVSNDVETPKSVEPPKKRKKRTSKQMNELDSSIRSEVATDKIDISIKLKLGDKLSLSTDLHEKCNGLYNGNGSPPRINGSDVSSFGASMEVSPNTALKLKIRKITPKQNQPEGKRKRGRPRNPQFVIVSEDQKDTSSHSTLCQLMKKVEKIHGSGKELPTAIRGN